MQVIRCYQPRAIILATCLALILDWPLASNGQLPVARLASLFPPGGKAGTSLEVTISGSDLDDPVRVLFGHPGITTSAPTAGTKFQVSIASNVPPGTYEARWVGRFGISNPRRFVVSSTAEIQLPATNTSAANAVDLAPNVVVNSQAPANAFSWFRFKARKGQRLLVECMTETIDSRMEPILLLSDANGREHERSRSGGLVDFTAPADGSYLLKVADFLYRGDDDYFFRLTVSTGPWIDYVLPAAGIPGTKADFALYGRNLPGGKPVKDVAIDGKPLEKLSVSIRVPPASEAERRLDLPGAAGMDAFEFRFKGANGPGNPVWIALVDGPGLVEVEPNPPAQPGLITPPCVVSGQFFPGGDVDSFIFEARKGDVYRMEVISQRLGAPTGPFLLVQRVSKDEKGEWKASDVLEQYASDTNLGDREFNTIHRDPSGRFEAKEDGTYRVTIRDLFNPTVASPANTYALVIRRESPDFRLVAQAIVPKYKSDAKNVDVGVAVLRRGETLPIRVVAFRQDGFNGEIELGLETPPAGLTAVAGQIESGKNTGLLLLTAAADAPPFAGPVRLIGRARLGDQEVARRAAGGTVVFPVGNTDTQRPKSRTVPEFSLAIMDQELAPISVAPTENRGFEVASNGKLEVPLTITRRGEFKANLKLKPIGPGAGDALKEFEVEAKATNATLKLDPAALKLGPGNHVFAVQGITTGKYRNNPEAATLAEATAKEAEKLADKAATAAKAAADNLEKAGQSLAEAEGAAKAASEKLAAAKAALEKAPQDEQLKASTDAAAKSSEEATARILAAKDARTAAEKAKVDSENRVREAQAKKDDTARRAKELNDKAKARDVSYQLTSAPIQVKVVAAPAADKTEKNSATKQASSK